MTNETNKAKKKNKGCLVGLAIAGVLLLLLVLGIMLLPRFLFSDYEGLPTTGSYEVRMTQAILVVESRVESFETDGSKREVPAYFFYPDTQEGSFPLVVFSHGAFGYYQSNTSTYMELASHGYVVVSLDHPYHSFFTTDTDGKTIIVNMEFMQQVMASNGEDMSEDEIIRTSRSWLDIRNADINFVLDSIKSAQNGIPSSWHISDDTARSELETVLSMTNTEKIGLMGHSMGGAAAVTVGRTRSDVDAVIDLDGTMLGEQFGWENGVYDFYEEAYPVPLLSVINEAHYFEAREVGDLYVNNIVLENAVDARYTYFKGSGHMNFTDLPLFSPPLADMLGVGEVDAESCVLAMNGLVLEYFDCYLKDGAEVEVKESY